MRQKLRVLDLFSGIGGFSLGLERTGGFETVAFCEIEEFPRRVLAKHWPEVPCYHDVRELTADTLRRDGIAIDVICGGFPCQDISLAGKGAGLEGERSGLWSEIARLSSELRPVYIIVENVSALLGRGLGTVLGDLASLGYDAEWHCIPASAIGAPHRRDRFWLVAHPNSGRRGADLAGRDNAYWKNTRRSKANCLSGAIRSERRKAHVADANSGDAQGFVPRGHGSLIRREQIERQAGLCRRTGEGQWSFEPDVGRVAHGIPSRVDRIKGLGNAVVPQIPEMIGYAILEAERVNA